MVRKKTGGLVVTPVTAKLLLLSSPFLSFSPYFSLSVALMPSHKLMLLLCFCSARTGVFALGKCPAAKMLS